MLRILRVFPVIVAATLLPGAASPDTLIPPPSYDFGIDKDTRDFIGGLPDQIKAAFVDGVKQVLPQIDRSVDEYIKQFNSQLRTTLSLTLDAMQCTALGTTLSISDHTVDKWWREGFGLGNSSITVDEIAPLLQNMGSSVEKSRARIKTTDRLKTITLAYGDMLNMAAVVHCKTKIDGPVVDGIVQDEINTLSPIALEWLLLSQACGAKTISECYEQRYESVSTLVATSDPRDVTKVNAVERLQHFPTKALDIPGFWTQLTDSKSLNIFGYELLFAELRSIERGVLAEKLGRFLAAWKLTETLKQKWPAVDLYIQREINATDFHRWEHNSPEDYYNGVVRTPDMQQQLNDLKSIIAQAVALEPSYGDKLAACSAAVEDRLKIVQEIFDRSTECQKPSFPRPNGKCINFSVTHTSTECALN